MDRVLFGMGSYVGGTVETQKFSSADMVEPKRFSFPKTTNITTKCAGQTVALLGSSGVGTSTLINSLAGKALQATRSIREDDAKGRHTTTNRSLHMLEGGGLLLDSPGMRELGITEVESGLASAFADVEAFAEQCRFNDCAHQSEPGCAVLRAIESGALDARRVESYRKLRREEMYNTETVAERHARVRQFSKMVRQHQDTSHKRRD